jgi:hypothetical protein
MSSHRDNPRIEVGGGSLPIGPIAIALVVLGLIVLGAAYASRTPYGAEVKLAPEVENAVKEHFAKTQLRVVARMTAYNCADFSESMLSGRQSYAAVIEGGAWRPGFEPDDSGDLYISAFRRDGESDWQIASVRVPGERYDPSEPKDDETHPCSTGIFAAN